MRWANVHEQDRYVTLIERGTSPREQMETVQPLQAFHEEFFLGLRQLEGIDFERVARDYEPHLANLILTVRSRIDSLGSAGLMELEGERLRIAPNRLTVSNEVLVHLLG